MLRAMSNHEIPETGAGYVRDDEGYNPYPGAAPRPGQGQGQGFGEPRRRMGQGQGPGTGQGGRRRPGLVGRDEPRVRRGSVRIPSDVAFRVRGGHPWVYRDSLGSRPMRDAPGEVIELLDGEDGSFVGRGIYDPAGPIAVRVITRNADEPIDAQAFLRRVRAAQSLRAMTLPIGAECDPGERLTAYRVLHGEGDFLPGVTVDRYCDFLVVHLFSAALEPHLPLLCDALEAVHQPAGIYVQKRFRPLGGDGPREPAELVRGPVAPVELDVQEGALHFGVDVTAPLGTGLFPDLRRGRQAVRGWSRGRKVLNLFSYTGALSLYAASGGATEVVSVDLSPKAHARARRNLQLSGLGEAGHEFVSGDALAVMARMLERKRRFDMVILDPPAFAQSRGQTFSVQRDYRDLVAAALPLCSSGALLCCAANAAKFSLEELNEAIGQGAGRGERHVRLIEQHGLPPDFPVPAGFPEGHYLKFVTCAVV